MKKQHKKTAMEKIEKVLWIIFAILFAITLIVPFVSAVGITNDGIPHVAEEVLGGDTYINQSFYNNTYINGSSYNATYETDITNLLGSTGAFNSTFNQSYHDDIANLLASTSAFNSTFNQSYADGTLWNGTVHAGHITIHPLNLTTSVGIGTDNVNQYYRFAVKDPLYNETYSVISSAGNGNSTLLFAEADVVRYKIFYDAKIALFQIYSFAIDKTIMIFNAKGDVEITRDLKIDNNLTVVGNITTEQIYANNICYNNGSNCNVSLTGYVPYNGATENVNLGLANLTENASINFGSIGALDGEDRRNLMYFLGGDYGDAIADGFRVEYNYNLTLPNDDWLMFIKTDSNDASPDGGIGFGWINGSGYNRTTFLIDGYGNANFTTYNVMTEGNITGNNIYGQNICYSNGSNCTSYAGASYNATYDGNLTTIYNLDASTGVFNSTANETTDALVASTGVFNATFNQSYDDLLQSTATFNSTFNSSYASKVNRGGDVMTGDLNMTNQISFIGNYLLRWLGVDEATVDAYIYELNGNLDFYLAGGNFTFNNNVIVNANVTADWFKGKLNYSDLQNVPAGGSGSTFNSTYASYFYGAVNETTWVIAQNYLTSFNELDPKTATADLHTHNSANLTNLAYLNDKITLNIANITSFLYNYNQTTPAITYAITIAGTADLHLHNSLNLTNLAGLTDKILLNGANITAGTINIARLPTLTDTHTLNILNITGIDDNKCSGTDKVSNVSFNNGQLNIVCTTDATGGAGGGATRTVTTMNADVSTTSSTTYNQTVMTLAVSANTNYTIDCHLISIDSASTVGTQFNVTVPASPTYWNIGFINSQAITGSVGCSGTAVECISPATTGFATAYPIDMHIRLINVNGNAVTIRIRSETGGLVQVKRGSYCIMYNDA